MKPPRRARWRLIVTAIALLALGLHFLRLRAAYADGTLVGRHRRFACGAIAMAADLLGIPGERP